METWWSETTEIAIGIVFSIFQKRILAKEQGFCQNYIIYFRTTISDSQSMHFLSIILFIGTQYWETFSEASDCPHAETLGPVGHFSYKLLWYNL